MTIPAALMRNRSLGLDPAYPPLAPTDAMRADSALHLLRGVGRALPRQVWLKPDLALSEFVAWVLVGSLSMFSLASAEELLDPTRPPVSVSAPVEASTASKPTGLQSILISKTRRAAIIDGETVELGGKHGEAKLIAVNEENVVLSGAHGQQVLSLFPEVKITQHHVKVDKPSTSHHAISNKHKAKRIVRREKK